MVFPKKEESRLTGYVMLTTRIRLKLGIMERKREITRAWETTAGRPEFVKRCLKKPVNTAFSPYSKFKQILSDLSTGFGRALSLFT
jgi:hypothetical protein